MKNSINIGKGMDRIKVYNLEDIYDEPEICFEREMAFGTKEYKLEEWQINQLIELVSKYLKSLVTFEKRKLERVNEELESLEKRREELLTQK